MNSELSDIKIGNLSQFEKLELKEKKLISGDVDFYNWDVEDSFEKAVKIVLFTQARSIACPEATCKRH